jgi:hypothetical protein
MWTIPYGGAEANVVQIRTGLFSEVYAGKLEYSNPGILRNWDTVILGYIDTGILGYWDT